ncbi:hypothetical protein [Chelatococcus sambhunathii]|nr:hypothetical protein [Chelatococcus sambhunathii]
MTASDAAKTSETVAIEDTSLAAFYRDMMGSWSRSASTASTTG